jgi:predicted nucleic acid-binding protein
MSNRNIFLDANVIMDYLLERKYHTENAKKIFEHAQKFSIGLYMCSYTVAIAYHHMRNQKTSHNIAINMLEGLFPYVKCLPVTEAIIKQALKSKFSDFEDAIQYYCASQISECEAIITRNPKDFALSSIPVKTPQQFLVRK